jgi:multidrug efflux pump subunit AcrA (membrane-fusion protein)
LLVPTTARATSGSISKQETDRAVSNLRAQKASVEANSANVKRLEDLQSFEKVYEPFDGVIMVRSTDIGALINAGAGTPAQELFHMAPITRLRLLDGPRN